MRNKLIALSLLIAAAAMAGSRERFSYVYKRGERTVIRVGQNLGHYKDVKKRYAGEYVWLYVGGRGYVICDASVLAAVRTAFAPMQELEPRMRAIEEKMRPIEQKFDKLERRHDELSDRDEEDAELERAFRKAEAEMEIVEREMEVIEREMDRREEIAEAKFEQIVLRAVQDGKAQRVD